MHIIRTKRKYMPSLHDCGVGKLKWSPKLSFQPLDLYNLFSSSLEVSESHVCDYCRPNFQNIQFVTYKWFHAIVAVAGSMHLWHLRTNVKALMQMRQKWEEKWRCHHTSCLFRFSATKLHSRVLSSQLLFFWLSSSWFELTAKNPSFFQLSIFRCIFVYK